MNHEQARHNMIESQVRPWDVLDPDVLAVLSQIRREDFVTECYRDLAFADLGLPLGHGEVMMKPVIEGRLLQALALQRQDRVLEIGTGSGFITACLAQLANDVVSVEQHADLAEIARTRLSLAGVYNARIDVADAIKNYDPRQTFEVVVVTGAVYALPEKFRTWIKPGGRLFAIVGESPTMQAMLHTRIDNYWQATCLFETDLPYLTNATPPQRFVL